MAVYGGWPRSIGFVSGALIVFGLAAQVAPAAAPESGLGDAPAVEGSVVERVEIRGNQYLQKETLLFYVSTKAGDRYDERRLREDFQRLWGTGFLDDLSVESIDTSSGKVVVFVLTERKRVQIVDYRGSKVLTTTAIEDKLKEKDAQLRIDSFYTIGKARRVEAIIGEMLEEKGRRFGTVKHDAKTVGGAGMQVSFTVDDGPKSYIKTIEFEGNGIYGDGKLRGRMKKLKPRGFWNLSWVSGASTYTDEKWQGGQRDDGDQKRLYEHYLNNGYVTATVGQPEFTYSDGKAGFFKKKPVKWIHVKVPVTEGEQYRVGEVKFEGMTVFNPDLVRPLFKLETGEIYKESRINKGFEKLRDAYGAQGYFQFTPSVQRKHDAERKVVDVVLKMEEDKRYFVGRINFTGNHSTRDKVIRREVYLTEGDVFNTELLKLSIRRINQLGYFKPMEGAPGLTPSEQGDDKLDVTFNVEEQNRNQFTFGGGVSGLEGAFLNAGFQTANFLGLGETLQISAQTGARTRNYQVAITEPYFLDRPITAGIDLFARRTTFLGSRNSVAYVQGNSGVTLTSGFPVSRFSRLFASYSYQLIQISDVDQEVVDALRGLGSGGTGLVPGVVGSLAEGLRYESQLAPSWVRNTVDNPFTPRSGSRYSGRFQFVGGPLGGTADYYRPSLELILYQPVGRRMALGLRGEGGYVRPFGSTTQIPYDQRYFLGGENQIRGFDARSVTPFEPRSGGARYTALGGNKFVLFNAEYYFDVASPVRLLAFFDAGEAYLEGQGVSWKTWRTSAGAELRFLVPVLNVPFRLIYAYNANRDFFQPKTAFKFAVGTTF